MKFKVEKGTKTYENLLELFAKIENYNSKTRELVESLGFEEFGIAMRGRAGGLSCIRSMKKPEGFKIVGKPSMNLYMPKASNKELWDKIEALPILSIDEYNEAIGFQQQFKGLNHIRSYGCQFINGVFLIDTGDADYSPVDGVIEILESEYRLVCKIQ